MRVDIGTGASEEEEGVRGCRSCWDIEEVVRVGSSCSYAPPNWTSIRYAFDSLHSFNRTPYSWSYVPVYGDEPLRECDVGVGVYPLIGGRNRLIDASRIGLDNDGKYDSDIPRTWRYVSWRALWNRRVERA